MRDSVKNCIYRNKKTNECSCPAENAKGRTGCTIAIRGYDIDCENAMQGTLFSNYGVIKPKKYRKKPVVIDAIQFDGNNHRDVCDFCEMAEPSRGGDYFEIKTLEGTMKANINDWIIKGVKGEYYPCKSDIFEATYEELI